jgi:hypothetical protein
VKKLTDEGNDPHLFSTAASMELTGRAAAGSSFIKEQRAPETEPSLVHKNNNSMTLPRQVNIGIHTFLVH